MSKSGPKKQSTPVRTAAGPPVLQHAVLWKATLDGASQRKRDFFFSEPNENSAEFLALAYLAWISGITIDYPYNLIIIWHLLTTSDPSTASDHFKDPRHLPKSVCAKPSSSPVASWWFVMLRVLEVSVGGHPMEHMRFSAETAESPSRPWCVLLAGLEGWQMPLAINSIICIYMCIEIYLYIYLFMYIYR
jgi:hypothetical protein